MNENQKGGLQGRLMYYQAGLFLFYFRAMFISNWPMGL
jgi:hypothetical protein